jgi:tetratricopeptide (TPR) repeat protein
MKAKWFTFPAALLALAMAFTVGASASRAGQPAGPAQDKKEKVNKAEEAAYKTFFATQGGDPAMQIQLGEDFITKFPMSKYLPGVYSTLTNAYYATGNMDKMFASGAKALELTPNNVDVLALLAMAIPRREKATNPDYAAQMKNAEDYAHRAIELMPTLEKPPNVDDATFEKAKNDKLSLAHSGLGLIDLNMKKDYEGARTEFTQAVALAASPDPVDYYLLGNADAQDGYLNGAIAAFEKCSATGPLTAACKAREDSVKKDKDSGTKLSRD